jgi:hypothetical protein
MRSRIGDALRLNDRSDMTTDDVIRQMRERDEMMRRLAEGALGGWSFPDRSLDTRVQGVG